MDVDQPESRQVDRVILNDDLINELKKEDLIKKWKQQNDYIDSLEEKLKLELSSKEMYQDNEDKIKQQLFDLTRKENLLAMKLTTKEHEIQDYIKQIQELKLSQIASNDRLQSTFIDPAVNMIFEEMKKVVENSKLKVEEMQSELSAWKFTPDSNTGKRLMAKCRLLYQENEELGKVISSGRVAKLEGELALQKSFSEEMKKSQGELDEFLFEIEEDVEGMQSTIYHLQQQLKEAKDSLQKYQLKEESQTKDETNSTVDKQLDKSTNELSDEKTDKSEDTSMDVNKETDCNVKDKAEDDKPEKDKTNDDKVEDDSTVNPSSNRDLVEEEEEKTSLAQNNGDQLSEQNQTNEDEKSNLERKRSLDEALEEVNASGLMSDCGIDSIIKKHRKLEKEKTDHLKNS